MDYSLITDEEIRAKHFAERGSYSAVDEKNQLIINTDLDIALLMLYGHILYSGSSYIFALSELLYNYVEIRQLTSPTDYFLRALALDPENPMINLSCGLAYVHYALRRQADNRQYLILQGLTFLFTYYDSRKTSTTLDERQEAHYNIARVYHMLGLTNLAVPYYELVFKELEGAEKVGSREDLVTDAAYNLQSIYAMSGNQELAMKISRKWLVM
jgi:general transcription factor 3C polypeptide 3 (transcription factor C subunit 4)